MWLENGVKNATRKERKEFIDTLDAIEGTITCFDRVVFFLLGGDAKLKNESPDWIWTIANKIWKRLGKYVVFMQETDDANWGKYFRRLADEAIEHLPNGRNQP